MVSAEIAAVADAFTGSRGGLRCAPCPRCGCERREPEKGVPEGPIGRDVRTELPFGVYPGLAITVRRNVLSNVDYRCRPHWGDGKSDRVGHDSWLWSVAPCFGKTAILNDRLAAYRQHQNLYGDAHLSLTSGCRLGALRGSAGAAAWQERIATYLSGLAQQWEVSGESNRAARAGTRQPSPHAYSAYLGRRAAVYQATSVSAGVKAWAALLRSRSGTTVGGHLKSLAKDGLSIPLGLVPRRGIGAET